MTPYKDDIVQPMEIFVPQNASETRFICVGNGKSESVPSETNEAFSRDFFLNACECVRSLTCIETRFRSKTRLR
jgi:hypothetical protein